MIKKFTLFIIVASLALSACENENNEPVYGKIEYNGKAFEINTLKCFNSTSLQTVNSSYMILANITNDDQSLTEINCQFDLMIENPRVDFVSDAMWNSQTGFLCGDTFYSSVRMGNGTESLGIDPATGNELFYKRTRDKYITSGWIEWMAGKNSAKLEFDFTFDDGKTAKGNATIPYSVFEKSQY